MDKLCKFTISIKSSATKNTRWSVVSCDVETEPTPARVFRALAELYSQKILSDYTLQN